MNNLLFITFEILVIVVFPLLILYLKGGWRLRSTIPGLVIIPVLWYFIYSPLHELSHAAGAYLVGGSVTHIKLIPRFWMGEFSGGAEITPAGLVHTWQSMTMTLSPYFLDVLCLIAGYIFLRRRFMRNPFVVGLTFMILCLRPAFDIVTETVAFLGGARGDLFCIREITGGFALWSLLAPAIALSVFTIIVVLRRFINNPEEADQGPDSQASR